MLYVIIFDSKNLVLTLVPQVIIKTLHKVLSPKIQGSSVQLPKSKHKKLPKVKTDQQWHLLPRIYLSKSQSQQLHVVILAKPLDLCCDESALLELLFVICAIRRFSKANTRTWENERMFENVTKTNKKQWEWRLKWWKKEISHCLFSSCFAFG